MSKTLEQIVEDLSALSVLDMSKLKTMLEDKWGVKAAAAAVAVAAPAAAAAPAVAESTEFQVTLEKSADDKKISVIKIVRELTGLGLKEAKELVESTPKVLKASCSKAEADDISKKVVAAGGQVTVKGL
ncbi:MAG: 50S ribosomal protein L7/L12 [Candidatus Rhabdochlamydia sp.]